MLYTCAKTYTILYPYGVSFLAKHMELTYTNTPRQTTDHITYVWFVPGCSVYMQTDTGLLDMRITLRHNPSTRRLLAPLLKK